LLRRLAQERAREAHRYGILGAFSGVILALMLVVSGAVRAEPVFSFDGHAGQASEDSRSDRLFNRAET
jgi:hypothetical protein